MRQLIRASIESASTSSKLRLTNQKVLVGAAVLTSDSTISAGSNFEGVSLAGGQSLSAEDCAIYRAICDRCQLPIKAMAVHSKHLLQQSQSNLGTFVNQLGQVEEMAGNPHETPRCRTQDITVQKQSSLAESVDSKVSPRLRHSMIASQESFNNSSRHVVQNMRAQISPIPQGSNIAIPSMQVNQLRGKFEQSSVFTNPLGSWKDRFLVQQQPHLEEE